LLQGLERQLETPKSININKKVEGQWTTKTQSQSQTYNKQRTCEISRGHVVKKAKKREDSIQLSQITEM
jgi:hypothetical protein